MQTTVKRWITDKGYGFLHNGGDAPDIMVHANELKTASTCVQGGQWNLNATSTAKAWWLKMSDWFKTSLKPPINAIHSSIHSKDPAVGGASAIKGDILDDPFFIGFPFDDRDNPTLHRSIQDFYVRAPPGSMLIQQPGLPGC